MNYQELMANGADKIGQPKEKDLFTLTVIFGNSADEALPAFLVRTAGRPKITNDEYEVDFLNTKRKFKGKTTFDPIDVTLIDPISPAASKKVWDWVLRHYDPESGMCGYKSTYAAREVRLDLLSPAGTIVETWVYHNVWINNGDFGELDYSTKEFQEISLSLTYDYPTLERVAV